VMPFLPKTVALKVAGMNFVLVLRTCHAASVADRATLVSVT
jgi:hypothetical protein